MPFGCFLSNVFTASVSSFFLFKHVQSPPADVKAMARIAGALPLHDIMVRCHVDRIEKVVCLTF